MPKKDGETVLLNLKEDFNDREETEIKKYRDKKGWNLKQTFIDIIKEKFKPNMFKRGKKNG